MAESVFLNIPYDKRFERLCVAYVVGLTTLGLTPRSAQAVSNGRARLGKIIDLIDECPYSIHDLSRVQTSQTRKVPRFNMPLELGLFLYHAAKSPDAHKVYIFEQKLYRVQDSTSDLNAFDIYIHKGTEQGVMVELRNIFVRQSEQSTVPQMMKTLRILKKSLPEIKQDAGVDSLFAGAAIANKLVLAASLLAEQNS